MSKVFYVSENDTLLVLGNGFDLNCGLKSSFEAFFNTIKPYYDEVEYQRKKYTGTKIKDEYLNIWYAVFYTVFYIENDTLFVNKYRETNWFNIEAIIKDMLCTKCTGTYNLPGYLTQLFNIIRNLDPFEFPHSMLNNFISYYVYFNDIKYADPNKFLFDELKRFENDFKLYLKGELISNDSKYKENVNRIVDDYLIGPNSLLSVINFNYTSIKTINNKVKFERNIHGSLDDEIIIGIDPKETYSNIQASNFSKSWRILSNLNDKNFELPDNIKKIVFYGHSLGDQDLSYFYAIFNHYNILNKCDLFFYYTGYKNDPKDNAVLLDEYKNKIFNLINTYGLEVSKDTDGSSLLTRLELEGRIHILSIPKFN